MTLKIPLAARHSLELTVNWKKFTEDTSSEFGEFEFTRQEYTLAYHLSPYLALIGSYEYYDNTRSEFYDEEKDDFHFYSGTVVIKPIDDLYFKLFYGETPGGIKCSSGVCKNFPSFEGIRAECVIRF